MTAELIRKAVSDFRKAYENELSEEVLKEKLMVLKDENGRFPEYGLHVAIMNICMDYSDQSLRSVLTELFSDIDANPKQ